MLNLSVNNEFSKLSTVVLGIGLDFGGCPSLQEAYDPKSKQNIANNTFPVESDILRELAGFFSIFNHYNIDVIRPINISKCNQIFVRDVGFVIEDIFFISNMINKRSDELLGFKSIINSIGSGSINRIPADVYVEGGDVIVSEENIFIGFSKKNDFIQYEVSRTNEEALAFFSDKFPNKKVIGFELAKSDDNPLENCLHLDCCFQPLGLGHAIVYEDGFKNKNDVELIYDIFGKSNIIIINNQEMTNMFSNIFSISDNVIVSDKSFIRLNADLRERGYTVEEVVFSEISKMGGLLRCSTLPLIRNNEK